MKVRYMVLVSILVAVATLSSHVASLPVAGARVFPVQHAVNVVAGVFLGPGPAVIAAFLTGLLRNMLGTGTPLAFPGGMVGAFLAGYLYRATRQPAMAAVGELIGTGLVGALLAYPIAKLVLGRNVAALAYVVPFGMSSAVGAVLGFALVIALKNAGLDKSFR